MCQHQFIHHLCLEYVKIIERLTLWMMSFDDVAQWIIQHGCPAGTTCQAYPGSNRYILCGNPWKHGIPTTDIHSSASFLNILFDAFVQIKLYTNQKQHYSMTFSCSNNLFSKEAWQSWDLRIYSSPQAMKTVMYDSFIFVVGSSIHSVSYEKTELCQLLPCIIGVNMRGRVICKNSHKARYTLSK